MDDIPITKPFLPPREELDEIINGIYSREWLTNDGPILKKLEKNIALHQNVSDCAIVCNGTMALQIGIRTLGLNGAILTTPFTYIATASSLAWEGCKPIFVDLNRGEFNVSCEQLAQAYTKEVRGIVLTHCFGLPLDVKGIAQLAKDWDIPVLYDASHAFGTTVNGRSIFEFGCQILQLQ